ncbi:peptidase M24, structural domain-containing protein [Gorgonomyces haynaldii]|nr:peptidase M24, structural domain-containing protein [Gorgonomyces haynaldii]
MLFVRRLTVASEFLERRQELLKRLPPSSACIVPGYGLRYSTQGIFYPFHQSTNLLYLTGLNEPDACLYLTKDKTILFLQPTSPEKERWDGPKTGLQGAKTIYGADEAYDISTFPHFLNDLIQSNVKIYTDLDLSQNGLEEFHIQEHALSATHPSKDSSLSQFFKFRKPKRSNYKLSPILDQMRLIKSHNEIELMQKSGDIAGQAFEEAMKATKPEMTEHQLYATLDYHSRMLGANALSYVPVVAGGKNALHMHYVRNTDPLKDGNLVLEYGFYASDITRTWPVNGTFTKAQAELYQLVLDCEEFVISRSKVGTSLNALHGLSYEYLRRGMEEILNRRVNSTEMERLYPHHVSHYIGMDVHDCASISRNIPLEENMCITVGIYVPESDMYPEALWNTGIRIEDDVAITKDGPRVLTERAPKQISDIERIMNHK